MDFICFVLACIALLFVMFLSNVIIEMFVKTVFFFRSPASSEVFGGHPNSALHHREADDKTWRIPGQDLELCTSAFGDKYIRGPTPPPTKQQGGGEPNERDHEEHRAVQQSGMRHLALFEPTSAWWDQTHQFLFSGFILAWAGRI